MGSARQGDARWREGANGAGGGELPLLGEWVLMDGSEFVSDSDGGERRGRTLPVGEKMGLGGKIWGGEPFWRELMDAFLGGGDGGETHVGERRSGRRFRLGVTTPVRRWRENGF
jgi:hypothetical protein